MSSRSKSSETSGRVRSYGDGAHEEVALEPEVHSDAKSVEVSRVGDRVSTIVPLARGDEVKITPEVPVSRTVGGEHIGTTIRGTSVMVAQKGKGLLKEKARRPGREPIIDLGSDDEEDDEEEVEKKVGEEADLEGDIQLEPEVEPSADEGSKKRMTHYQIISNISDGKLVGARALLRLSLNLCYPTSD